MRKLMIVFLLNLLALMTGVTSFAQTKDQKKVYVYFWEFNHEGGGPEYQPFVRYVDRRAPLRPTIEAFVAGPTKEEEAKGFGGLAYGDMKLSKVEIRRGTARIDFTREIRSDYNPGDLETLRFEYAVIRTARQFPEIKKVIVCVNGMNEFGIGMTIDAAIPCPKNW